MKLALAVGLSVTFALAGCTAFVQSGGDIQAQQYLDQGAYHHAIETLVPNATNGDARAQEILGLLEIQHGDASSREAGIYLLTKAAQGGNVDAMYELSDVCSATCSVAYDDYWLAQAAEHGNLDGAADLARIYFTGDSVVRKDYAQARAWAGRVIGDAPKDTQAFTHPGGDLPLEPLVQMEMRHWPQRFAKGGVKAIRKDLLSTSCLVSHEYAAGLGVHQDLAVALEVLPEEYRPIDAPHAVALVNGRPVYAVDARKMAVTCQWQDNYALVDPAAMNGDDRVDFEKRVYEISTDISRLGVYNALRLHGVVWPKPIRPAIPVPTAPRGTLVQAIQQVNADFGPN